MPRVFTPSSNTKQNPKPLAQGPFIMPVLPVAVGRHNGFLFTDYNLPDFTKGGLRLLIFAR
jgi:hypothetical protein